MGGLGGDVDVDAGPEQGVGAVEGGAGGGTDPMSQRRDMGTQILHTTASRNRGSLHCGRDDIVFSSRERGFAVIWGRTSLRREGWWSWFVQ